MRNSISSVLCRGDVCFFFSSRRRHTRFKCDWSSDVCSSDLCLMSLLRRDARVRRDHPPRSIRDNQSSGNFQYWQRDAEEIQDEAAKEQKRHQDGKYPQPSLNCSISAILWSPGRGHGAEDRNAAKGVDDGKQRRKRGRRRMRQRAQELAESVGGVHALGNLNGLRISTPRCLKSFSSRVATVKPWTAAVAAIMASSREAPVLPRISRDHSRKQAGSIGTKANDIST